MTESRWRRARRHAITLGILVVLFFGMQMWSTRNAARGMAPGIEETSVLGDAISLAGFRGKPVLVHFWATWCGTCELMDGNVEAVAAGHRVITIASQSGDSGAVRGFLEEHGLRFPAVADPRGELAREYGVTAFPTSFFVREDGSIAHTSVGYSTEWGLRGWLFWTGL